MLLKSGSLGHVELLPGDEMLVPQVIEDFTDIAEYSRFKFGDGEVSKKYGFLLGELACQDIEAGDDVLVTSSAYKFAPPASESLVLPFVQKLREEGINAHIFKISKAKLATDNYASLSFAERASTLQNDLILPAGLVLDDKKVIALDDIRVTGLREAALTNLFANSGVNLASFFYVLDVENGKEHPQTEAVINIRSVRTIEDVIVLAQKPDFVPNVRLCKFIISRSIADLQTFCDQVPDSVASTVVKYIEEDNLREVVKTIP